ncbi:hypothetical protein LCGC14_2034700 [marine sediment metagenome]|uniref:ASCH domain-containing protein n=1 Tax=marine sediment metagenome TaxID=412755 RepID=A0A0F9ETW2_9ZZZZ
MLKERPILFSGEMVRAMLEGRKTQTRRVMRVQPYWVNSEYTGGHWMISGYEAGECIYTGPFKPAEEVKYGPGSCYPYSGCQYGLPGDCLWVRETWKAEKNIYESRPCVSVNFKASPDIVKVVLFEEDIFPSLSVINKWKSSIHMPRWASRINLEITAIRVERVQEISAADARAEGIYPTHPEDAMGLISNFHILWDSINAKRGYPWVDNPWVWVVEFKRVEG